MPICFIEMYVSLTVGRPPRVEIRGTALGLDLHDDATRHSARTGTRRDPMTPSAAKQDKSFQLQDLACMRLVGFAHVSGLAVSALVVPGRLG